MFTIEAIESLDDNYIWCLAFTDEKLAIIVDPGDATPVLKHLQENKLELHSILVTHRHNDHTGGIQNLLNHKDVTVYGPHNCPNPLLTQRLAEGDMLNLLGVSMHIHEMPAHTLDHIIYKIPKSDTHPEDILLCGDTLFRAGCGRLFEGTPEQLRATMDFYKAQDESAVLYPTHEYSLANLAFANAVEPLNAHIQTTKNWCLEQRKNQQPTLPTTINDELKANPFLRYDQQSVIDAVIAKTEMDSLSDTDVVKHLRLWKDNF